MALLNKRRVILAKIESTYGTDPTPTGSANAILVANDIKMTPLDAQIIDRNVIRSFLGNGDQILSSANVKVSFDVELQGSGTAGTAPGWGPLLRACGFAETLTAAPVTGTAQAGGTTTTVKLAAGASATDDFYIGMTVSITAGTGNGQTGVIVDYNGTSKVATIASAWAAGPDATSSYSIAANAQYKLVSSAFESVTIYFGLDGVQHKVIGARGNVKFTLNRDAIPVMSFDFVGTYSTPTDTALPTGVYTGFQSPIAVNRVNTPYVALHGLTTGLLMDNFMMDMKNQVVFRSLVGSTADQVLITDRQPEGSILMESVLVATKDWWTSAKNGTLGAFALTHGTAAGFKVQFAAGSVSLQNPSYDQQDQVSMLSMGLVPLPVTGNDEFTVVAL